MIILACRRLPALIPFKPNILTILVGILAVMGLAHPAHAKIKRTFENGSFEEHGCNVGTFGIVSDTDTKWSTTHPTVESSCGGNTDVHPIHIWKNSVGRNIAIDGIFFSKAGGSNGVPNLSQPTVDPLDPVYSEPPSVLYQTLCVLEDDRILYRFSHAPRLTIEGHVSDGTLLEGLDEMVLQYTKDEGTPTQWINPVNIVTVESEIFAIDDGMNWDTWGRILACIPDELYPCWDAIPMPLAEGGWTGIHGAFTWTEGQGFFRFGFTPTKVERSGEIQYGINFGNFLDIVDIWPAAGFSDTRLS